MCWIFTRMTLSLLLKLRIGEDWFGRVLSMRADYDHINTITSRSPSLSSWNLVKFSFWTRLDHNLFSSFAYSRILLLNASKQFQQCNRRYQKIAIQSKQYVYDTTSIRSSPASLLLTEILQCLVAEGALVTLNRILDISFAEVRITTFQENNVNNWWLILHLSD